MQAALLKLLAIGCEVRFLESSFDTIEIKATWNQEIIPENSATIVRVLSKKQIHLSNLDLVTMELDRIYNHIAG